MCGNGHAMRSCNNDPDVNTIHLSRLTSHVSRLAQWCTECTLHSFCVLRGYYLSRIEMRSYKIILHLYFRVLPCSSVAIIYPTQNTPFTSHVSRLTSHAMVHGCALHLSVFFRGFRGHFPSRLRSAPATNRCAGGIWTASVRKRFQASCARMSSAMSALE